MSHTRDLPRAQAYICRTGTIGTLPVGLKPIGNQTRTVQHAMLRRLINWFKGDSEPPRRDSRQTRRRVSAHAAVHFDKDEQPRSVGAPDFVEHESSFDGSIESHGPGKNVLVRKKYIREDTGTYETLKIVDESILDSGDEDGIDPYNSGEFDRSKNWDKRFRN